MLKPLAYVGFILGFALSQGAMASVEPSVKGSNSIRIQALTDTAITYGAQQALAWRSHQINNIFDAQGKKLDTVFNFRALTLRHNLMPPILEQTRGNLHMASDRSIRLADKIYKIVAPAHFVSTPMSWRDYIQLSYDAPERPNSSMLPKNADERALWDEQVAVGWAQGIQQAEQMIKVNLGRLVRDYTGMALYHRLLTQGMVSSPYVSKSNLGITGDSHEMRINDQIIRLTADSELLPKQADNWKVALT